MPMSSTHPLYADFLKGWKFCRDSYTPGAIKAAKADYLPPTAGMRLDGYPNEGQAGTNAYEAYWMRAYYPDIYKEAVAAAIGIMHRKPAVIELSPKLKILEERANVLGENLQLLLRRINTEQLVTGRLGLLGDLVVGADGKVSPVVVMYGDKAIRNWDDISTDTDVGEYRFVVLDETGFELQPDLSWEQVEKYLILGLVSNNQLDVNGTYQYAKAKPTDELQALTFEMPSNKGAVSDQIPFVIVNACDLNPTPDSPPLMGLAELCLAIYRGEADYRQNLFMQGQDTLVRVGGMSEDGEVTRTGAGASISVPMGGDAKYIGVNSQGLPEQRQSLETDYKRAYSKSGQITDATSRAKESGDALRIRVAAQSATLPQIATAGAMGLERVLKSMATWLGDNPDQVSVTPNLDFANEEFNGQTLVHIVQAKVQGAPISAESIHGYMRSKNLTTLSYEDELAKISLEEPVA
jgi:hypothetical protein